MTGQPSAPAPPIADDGGSPSPTERPTTNVRGRRSALRRVVFWLVLLGASAIFVYPFVWLISASLKPRADVFDNLLIPQRWAPENYVTVWSEAPLFTWFVNSVTVGLAAALSVTVASSLVAFGFAYFRFPGRNLMFGLVLSTMMLPAAVTMIPVYLVWNSIGAAQSQLPLWAGNLFGSAFYIFLLRQFFLGLPRELFEAARIDGANYWTMFWRIAVPLTKPALVVTFIFEIQASWTDLMRPLIYLRDPELFTLPRGLKAILDQFGQSGEQQWEVVIAASVLITIPMIIVFFCGQRHFVQGIATQGRKG